MTEEKNTAPQERGADNREGNRSVRIIEVLEATLRVGDGTEQNPYRIITEYWSKGGELLAVDDPNTNAFE